MSISVLLKQKLIIFIINFLKESYRSIIKRVGIKFIIFSFETESEKYICQEIIEDLSKEPNFDFYEEGKTILE